MYFSLRLWGLTAGARRKIAIAVIAGLATATTGIARLALLGWLIAQIFEGTEISNLILPIAAVISITVIRGGLQTIKESIAYNTATEVQQVIRKQLLRKLIDLGPSRIDQRRTGDLSTSLVEGVELLETFFGQYLPQFFIAAITPIGVFIFMSFLDLPVAMIYLTFALATLAIPALLHRWNTEASRRRRNAYGSFAADFLDSIQGLTTLKAFGQSTARCDYLAKRAHDVFTSTMGVLMHNAFTQGVTILTMTVGAAVALTVGALQVQSGEMSLTVLLVILMLGVEVFRPLRELSQLFHQGLLGVSAAQGIWDILDDEQIVKEPNRVSNNPQNTSLSFRNVTFAYPESKYNALHDVSFEIAPGERVGVVGPSGAGKSTLLSLIQRLYDPKAGQILLGTINLKELSFSQIRSPLSVVTQDTYLFHDTVAANLRFGKNSSTQGEIEKAAILANAHDFISRLPNGYETMIGERGHRLSSGERQRIAIARSLLREAPIHVLDEALSNIDTRNEAAIQDALEKLMQGRTTLIMAHRLSSILSCDKILVLEGGRLVESGTHKDLMAKDGVYTRLMASQAETVNNVEPTINEIFEKVSSPKDNAPPSSRIKTEIHTDAIIKAEGMNWVNAGRQLLGMALPEWPKVLGSFIAGVLRFIGLIAGAAIAALLVADVTNGNSVTGSIVILIIIAIATAIFTWIESWLSHDLAFRLLSKMRIDLFRKLDKLAPAYLLRRRSGDLVSMATQDVETVEYFFAHTIANAFVAVVIPLSVLITLGIFNWILAISLLPFLALAGITPFLTRGSIDKIGSHSRDQLGRLNAHGVDTIQGLREILAFEQGDQRVEGFRKLENKYIPLRLAFNRQITIQRVLVEVLMGLGGLTVLIISGALVANGNLSINAVPLLTLLAMGAFLPIAELAMIGRRLGDSLGAARRLTAVQTETVVVTDGAGTNVDTPRKVASGDLQSVDFTYHQAINLALSDVSFKIDPGATVALVGPSGAGKTTIAHLLLRFWDPESGVIHLDNADLKSFRLDEMRDRIALVSQDTYLFNASIRENLLIAKPKATPEEVNLAIKRASLQEFIRSLPDGIDTIVGERGAQLSGGQRQRVAIGRALLKDAPLLILDEATSHLDSFNEQMIRDGLDELLHNRTTLIIAHRLSTIRDADLIIVLESGRIVDAGSHMELIKKPGLYAQLVYNHVRNPISSG